MSTMAQVPVADMQGPPQGPPQGLAQGSDQGPAGVPDPPGAGFQAPVQGHTQAPTQGLHQAPAQDLAPDPAQAFGRGPSLGLTQGLGGMPAPPGAGFQAAAQAPAHGLAQAPAGVINPLVTGFEGRHRVFAQGAVGLPFPPGAGFQAPVQGLAQGAVGMPPAPDLGSQGPPQAPDQGPAGPVASFQDLAGIETSAQAKKDELDALKAEVHRAISDMKLHLPTGQQTIVGSGAEETLANIVKRCQRYIDSYTLSAVVRKLKTVRSDQAALRGASASEVVKYYRCRLASALTFMELLQENFKSLHQTYETLLKSHRKAAENMDLRFLQAYNAQAKLADIEAQNDMIKAGYASLETEYADLKIEKDVLQADYLKLREECHKLGVERDELQSKYSLLNANMRIVMDADGVLRAECAKAKAEKTKIQAEFSKFQEGIANDKTFDNLMMESLNLRQEGAKQREDYRKLCALKNELEAMNQQLRAEKHELKAKNDELEAEDGQIKARNGQLEVENDRLKGESEQQPAMYEGAANL